MKFALLLLSTSLNLSVAADATRAVAARALETAEEKKAAADVVKALDLGDVVHSVTVAEQTYTVRTSVENAEAVLDAIEGLDDDALNGCCSVPKPS